MQLADEARGREGLRAERQELVRPHAETELLFELACGADLGRLARLDEARGQLPENAGHLRVDRPERDRRTDGAPQIHAGRAVRVEVVSDHDRGVERTPGDHVVTKRRALVSALDDGELVTLQGEEAFTLVGPIGGDIERDLGKLRQYGHGVRHPNPGLVSLEGLAIIGLGHRSCRRTDLAWLYRGADRTPHVETQTRGMEHPLSGVWPLGPRREVPSGSWIPATM